MNPVDPSARARTMSLSVDWDLVFGANRKSSKILHGGFAVEEKPSYEFVTSSKYKGQWNKIGMAGFGTYTFPTKAEYEGHLVDSMFDNEGTLTYPMGQKIEGIWEKDVLISFKYIFSDGLEYDYPWTYCRYPDRRFWTSIIEGLRPGGRELLTNDDPPRKIPDGCYDTGDGFYDPRTKIVTSVTDPQKILRIPTLTEEKWIMENCRKAWDEPVGYKPELYERWTSGRSCEEYEVGELGEEDVEEEAEEEFVHTPRSSESVGQENPT